MATQKTGAAALQTGKGRASRIPLDYFKRLNGMEKAKLGLTVVALCAAGLWLALGALGQSGGSMRFARGPVASVHAATETDCMACHVSFSPMSEQNLFMRHPSSADAKCLSCHSGDEHHKNAKPESVASCAGCHREHQGRDFSLVRISDKDCTSCHKELKNHLRAGESTEFADGVTTFMSHPEFGTYSKGLKDPGALKFNHKLHLAPGQGSAFTLGRIKGADEATYARFKSADWQTDKSDAAAVQLDCASCHVTKPGGHGETKTAGRYMQPATYDTNCKACHPLTFDPAVKERDGKPFALPHGKPFADIEDLLRREYTAAILQSPQDFRGFQQTSGLRPLPGRPPIEIASPSAKLDRDKMFEMAKIRAGEAARYLQGKAGCAECHAIENKTIVPVNVPDVWFRHAKFSHTSHSTMKCAECHGGAKDSAVHTDVLLPGVKSCQDCHSPPRVEDGKLRGGVRYECTTCHTYHHGDR